MGDVADAAPAVADRRTVLQRRAGGRREQPRPLLRRAAPLLLTVPASARRATRRGGVSAAKVRCGADDRPETEGTATTAATQRGCVLDVLLRRPFGGQGWPTARSVSRTGTSPPPAASAAPPRGSSGS